MSATGDFNLLDEMRFHETSMTTGQPVADFATIVTAFKSLVLGFVVLTARSITIAASINEQSCSMTSTIEFGTNHGRKAHSKVVISGHTFGYIRNFTQLTLITI